MCEWGRGGGGGVAPSLPAWAAEETPGCLWQVAGARRACARMHVCSRPACDEPDGLDQRARFWLCSCKQAHTGRQANMSADPAYHDTLKPLKWRVTREATAPVAQSSAAGTRPVRVQAGARLRCSSGRQTHVSSSRTALSGIAGSSRQTRRHSKVTSRSDRQAATGSS